LQDVLLSLAHAALCVRDLLLQAASFRLSFEKVFTPLVTLSMLIQNNPQLAAFQKSFPKVAQQLMDSVSLGMEIWTDLAFALLLRCCSAVRKSSRCVMGDTPRSCVFIQIVAACFSL
jgi:hypothetical protein